MTLNKVLLIAIVGFAAFLNNTHARYVNSGESKIQDKYEQTPDQSNLSQNQLIQKSTKKDLFSSRGWGAGGLPYSVLYLKSTTPTVETKKYPKNQWIFGPRSKTERPQVNIMDSEDQPQAQALQQENMTTKTNKKVVSRKARNHRKYSHIPQLFVSYGWGPMGK